MKIARHDPPRITHRLRHVTGAKQPTIAAVCTDNRDVLSDHYDVAADQRMWGSLGGRGVERGTIAVITPPRGSLSTTRFAAVSTVIIIRNGKGEKRRFYKS